MPGYALPQRGSYCDSGHWVDAVAADGELVILEDGSVWQIDAVDAIDAMLWLPTEQVIICPGELINSDNGDKVGAYRVR